MKVIVQVKAGKKEDKVEEILHTPIAVGGHPSLEGADYKVSVKASAREGKANKAVVKVLAAYFGVSASRVEILAGFKAKKKVIRIIKK